MIPTWLPLGAVVVFSMVLILDPVRPYWGPAWLLLALPVSIAQAGLNELTEVVSPARSRSRAVVSTAIITGGLASVLAVAWFEDWQRLDSMMSGRLEAGARVFAIDRSFSIEVPDAGWRKLVPGTVGDSDALVELASADELSWIIGYRLPPDGTLNGAVLARYEVIHSVEGISESSDRRFFWSPERLDVASYATYEVGDGRLFRGHYEVLTIRSEDEAIELIGFTSRRMEERPPLEKMLRSLELTDE